MFGSSGYAAPVMSMLGTYQNTYPHKYKQSSSDINSQNIAFAHQQQCDPTSFQSSILDISMDLLQYMSESLADPWSTTSTRCQQPHKTCQQQQQEAHTTGMQHCSSLMGSRCSTDCSQDMPDTPTCSKAQQQQQQQQPPSRGTGINSSNSSCDTEADALAQASSIPSSAVSDAVEDTLQSAASLPSPSSNSSNSNSSSSKAYDETFVWQCYYGDPSSPENQQQQRVKPLSPFAAFSTFPGFSL